MFLKIHIKQKEYVSCIDHIIVFKENPGIFILRREHKYIKYYAFIAFIFQLANCVILATIILILVLY